MFHSNDSSSSSNVTEEERRRLLDQLYEEALTYYLPSLVFMGLVALVGVIGNTTVLVVYSKKVRSKKYPSDATDIFIMAIASFDLLTNVGIIPAYIYYCLTRYEVVAGLLCQLGFYFNGVTTMSSMLLLLGVAYTRYKMTCDPFGKQVSKKAATISCIALPFVIGIILIPVWSIYNIANYPTKIPGIFTRQCTFNYEDQQRVLSILFFAFLGLLALVALGLLLIWYGRICIEAWRFSKRPGGFMAANTPTSSKDTLAESKDSKSLVSRGPAFLKRIMSKDIPSDRLTSGEGTRHGGGVDFKMENKTTKDNDEDNHTPEARGVPRESSIESKECVSDPPDISSTCQEEGEEGTHHATSTKPSSQNRVLFETTLMMAVITAVLVISTLPTLAFIISDHAIQGFYDGMNTQERQAYQLFMRLFFINSAANAIIYGFCNGKFREEVVAIFCCRKGP